MSADANTLSVAAFTALGTIVGYLGTEVASASIFDRLLWPSRYYNTRSLRSLSAIAVLMPFGGPIHKAAVEALDQTVAAGLWKGYCRGDMLRTPFYHDTKQSYTVRNSDGCKGEKKDARNAFWITVLGLVSWQSPIEKQGSPGRKDDKTAAEVVRDMIAQRPVLLLKLARASGDLPEDMSMVNGDTDNANIRQLLAVITSEALTLVTGIITAAVWKSCFSIWYLGPIMLKLISFFCHVRRSPGEVSAVQAAPRSAAPGKAGNTSPVTLAKDEARILCEIEDFSKGFMMIDGPSELVLQFFRHYGHPVRHKRGIFGDRVWEVISMLTVTGSILVYPGGLITFIFAPIAIQWVWLGYQLYAILAMHIYRFGEAEHVGTTQEWIARELSSHKKVCFDMGGGNRVIAQLANYVEPSVAQGREKVKQLVTQVMNEHIQHHQVAL